MMAVAERHAEGPDDEAVTPWYSPVRMANSAGASGGGPGHLTLSVRLYALLPATRMVVAVVVAEKRNLPFLVILILTEYLLYEPESALVAV